MLNLQASSITSRLSLAVSYSLNRGSLLSVSIQYQSIRAQKFSSHLNKRCLNSCASYRGLATMASDSSKYKLNHTMIRVKEPNRSIKFYEFLGMKLIRKYEQPEAKFDLYFMGFDSPKSLSHGKHFSDREGLIELTHNYGTEIDPDYAVSPGNVHPHKGFGHTCISVDNIQASCQRLEKAGYPFQKILNDGSMKNIAFVLDPDGYWVEIIGQNDLDETKNIQETNLSSYRLNHTMIRVKDPVKSLRFYQDVLGMKLISSLENKSANYNLYFLGYTGENSSTHQAPNENLTSLASREGLLELTWNYGTEADPDFKYHNGNDDPKGYGHICIRTAIFLLKGVTYFSI
ncbi:Lactoylglutathione lyase [Golovinomyces cichoracearum]|uniref:lactoylglutathione lyase n=1 Tax=Golovinomyces cichoracearum TaxID=62708 RepID=A0A420J2V6_9PEZI|nr:Lactoylglutathione lyase [Golovinomyces cichoracearum]